MLGSSLEGERSRRASARAKASRLEGVSGPAGPRGARGAGFEPARRRESGPPGRAEREPWSCVGLPPLACGLLGYYFIYWP